MGVAVAKVDSRVHGNDKSGVACPRKKASKSKCEGEFLKISKIAHVTRSDEVYIAGIISRNMTYLLTNLIFEL